MTSSSVGSTSGTSTVSGVITVQQSSQSQGAAVGILQPAPQYTLDVTGNARVTQNAVVSGGITTPQLSNSGSGLAVPEVVTASGLVVPSINPAGQNLQLGKGVTLLTPSGASAPLIGICNTSPSTQLDVTGSAKVSGSVTAGSAVLPQINAGDQALQVGSNVWVSSKMVGVGKTPTVPLDVVGAVTATGLGTLSGGLVTPVINGSSQALNVANAITVTGGSSPLVGVLNGNPKSALDVTGNAAVSGSVTSASLTCAQINQAGGALTVASMLYMPGGAAPKLGILQSTPAYTLDVAGNGRFTQGLTTPALQLGNEALKVGSALWTTAGTTPSVGICNPSPQSTLDVTGSLNVSQGAVVGGLVTPVLNGGNQALQVGSAVWVTASSPPKVGVLQANPTTALDVLGSVNASTSVITPTVNGGAQPLDLVAGAVSVRASAVGLFTTTPGATLDVQGGGTLNVKTSATAPAVYCSTHQLREAVADRLGRRVCGQRDQPDGGHQRRGPERHAARVQRHPVQLPVHRHRELRRGLPQHGRGQLHPHELVGHPHGAHDHRRALQQRPEPPGRRKPGAAGVPVLRQLGGDQHVRLRELVHTRAGRPPTPSTASASGCSARRETRSPSRRPAPVCR